MSPELRFRGTCLAAWKNGQENGLGSKFSFLEGDGKGQRGWRMKLHSWEDISKQLLSYSASPGGQLSQQRNIGSQQKERIFSAAQWCCVRVLHTGILLNRKRECLEKCHVSCCSQPPSKSDLMQRTVEAIMTCVSKGIFRDRSYLIGQRHSFISENSLMLLIWW